jgi:hypothetical protein
MNMKLSNRPFYPRCLFFLFGVLLTLFDPLQAQMGTGSIQGTVYDSAGAIVSDAAVTIRNLATQAVFSTSSNSAGRFISPALVLGTYQVKAIHPGFQQTVVNDVVVEVGQVADVSITMLVGQASETVTVTGAPPELNTSDGTLGAVIDSVPVHDLPLNGRETLALTALTPGVRNATGPDAEGLGDRGDYLSAISINGSPAGLNAFLIDGLNNSETRTAEVSINPTVDAIQEFRVQSGTMSALYGYTAGGVVNLVTRSGTNQLHGAAYEFFRNDDLDAKPYFTAPGGQKAEFRYNQYGAAVGGPIIHDRTFFFTNYEQYSYIQGVPTLASVPTAIERNGDFSDLFGTNGQLIPIYNPSTTQPNPSGAGYLRQTFPGNVIPSGSLDPAALGLQNAIYPVPNTIPTNALTHANNYVTNVRTVNSMRQALGRLDHQFSPKNSAMLRYAYYHFETNNPDVLSGPASARNDSITNQSAILGDTYVFSPTLINDVRIGFTRNWFLFSPQSYNQNWPAKVGLPSNVPAYTIPLISNGLPSYATQVEFGFRAYTNPEINDTVTRVLGSHTLQFGVDWRDNIGSENLNANGSGSFTFTTGLTGNPQNPGGTGSAYASFLLGQVSSASATTLVGETDRAFDLAFYVQDDWKASPSLTWNLGLRYEYQQTPYDQNNHYSNWNPNLTQPNGLKGAYQFAGAGGVGRNFTNENYLDFSPRVGFAWSLLKTTVVRGGYGIYHPQTFTQADTNVEQGFSNTTSYTSANTNIAAFQLSQGLPSAPIPPLGSALGPSAFLGQSVTYQQAHYPTPMSQQWNLSVQRELPWSVVAQVTYIGNHGTHFASDTYNLNSLPLSYLSLGLALQQQVPNPYVGIVPGTLGGAAISRQQSLLPYPYYQSITNYYPKDGSFIAHYFELELQKRSSHGLTFMAGYTAGKLISTPIYTGLSFIVPGPLGYQNVFDRAAERSVDPTDVSQRATISAIYELPFGRGQRFLANRRFVSSVVEGWQLNNITVVQTGYPLAITGANNDLATRPNFVPGVSAKLGNRNKTEWFNTAAFVNPPLYTFGDVGRTLPNVRSPGTVNFDVSLFKTTTITEHIKLQLRLETFNLFNHPNLGVPNTTFSPGANGLNANGAFGTITSTGTSNRDVQLAAKVIF